MALHAPPTLEDLRLDGSKLAAAVASEGGDVILLHWLSVASRALDHLPSDAVVAAQPALTTTLLSLLTPPPINSLTPSIHPGRPARAIISRLLVKLLSAGDAKGLFDLGQTLLKGLVGSEGKGAMEREKEARVACGTCLAEVWSVFGNQVMSLFVEVVQTTTKVYRTTSHPVILRCAALGALRRAIQSSGKSMSDQLIKETVKALKYGLSDKAGAITRECAECLLAMSSTTAAFLTLPDIDNLISPSLRSLETADHVTRRSLSRLIAGLLATTQIEGSATQVPVAKKKKGEEEDDDPYPSTGAPGASGTSTKTLLSPTEMLTQLSTPYNRTSSSRRLRNGIIDVYAELFTSLGASWVEHYYAEIARHLIDTIGCGQAAGLGWTGWNARSAERTEPALARYDALAARKAVGILLRDIISGRLLSEPGQIMAARELGTLYLKKWPSLLPSSPPPSKQSLLIALDETSALLRRLGCAPPAVQDVLFDSLLRLVAHPSHSVQMSASWALRTFCHAAPTRLSGTIVQVVDLLNKDLQLLADPSPPADVHRRGIGRAHALASLINLIPHEPLYVSFDVSTKCMSLAIQLFKQSGNHELHVSGVEIQIACIIVGALMSLGPNFVRLHLPQLLILWRNALPKPTSKDASAAQVRGDNEWAFLLHIRECTLGAILSFLRHNGGRVGSSGIGLVNEDVGRRLVLLLSNGLAFASSFTVSHANILAEQTPSTSSQLLLLDRDLALRRRLLQCFVALGQNPATQPFQINLLSQVVILFSDPERYSGESATQAAVAASSGTFSTVWDQVDGYAFGVTSLMKEHAVEVAEGGEAGLATYGGGLNRDLAEAEIEEQLRISVLGAAEHDSLVLSSRHHSDLLGDNDLPSPPPAAAGLVDASIELFALYFTLQDPTSQADLLQQMTNNVRSTRLEKNPGRRMAVLANCITAILGSLRHIMRGAPYRRVVESSVGMLMREVIREALVHPDARLRQAGAESLGRLSSLGGTSFMATQIQFCVDQVVSNTDPDNRAGCAVAFGQIYNFVGGLAAGPVLKTIVDILLSLSADPHPLVHYNALQALSHVINSASLSYAPFTNVTLGMLCKLYMQDTHEPEGGSPGSVNLRGDLPAYQAICRVTDALIGVLGPELQDSLPVRDLVLILLGEFTREANDGVIVEAIKATQHFLMFAPDAINLPQLVTTLRLQLSSTRQPLKVAAVNSVYQLVQRDAALMSKIGGDGLVRELFQLLDDDPSIEGVRDAITSWLRQTADTNPSGWIDLCQRIMSRSAGTSRPAETATSFVDEETQGIGLDAEEGARPGAATSRTMSRWRTQLFALQCLHEVFLTVAKSGRLEHFDIARARAVRANRRGLLITRVADLIRMAFTASTAQVMEIRLEGLVVLRDVIENFSQSQDLDFEEALLLDQYQAPIAAALTPAFAADSYPEVLASAVQICAVFVGSGVVKEIEKMGRILRLLTTALESCRDSDMSSLGDVRDLSSTAQVMLKTSIFAAWAQFQTASVRQPYLVDVIRPHLPLLCPFWVASLREYARVRTDPDAASSDSGAGGAAFDSVYSGLSRETALPFYERSWPQMLHAVATLLKANNIHMLRAVDGLDTQVNEQAPLIASTREAPALFFWVLFGLSFEALCATPPPSGSTSIAAVQEIALESVVGLIRPEVSGTTLLERSLFEELCNLCYRLAITEGPTIKVHVMHIALQLATTFNKELIKKGAVDGVSIKSDDKMTQCLRVATCVLSEAVPSSSSPSSRVNVSTVAAHIVLVKSAFSSFVDLADLYPMPMREELYAIAFHFYSQLLRDESSEVDLVGPTLPILKMLCDRGFSLSHGTLAVLPTVVNGMLSACLQNVDDTRSRSGRAATLKTKNNLLASVLLLTALPSSVKIGQAVVEHACFLITQVALSDDSETSVTALHCLTSLLVAGARGSGVLQFCVGQLLPGVIEYIVRAAESDYAVGDRKLVSLGEVLKAFVSVLSGVGLEHRTQALSILLPVLILLLSPTSTPLPPSHTIAISHLLVIASLHSANFKEATVALNEEEKKVLEVSIRASVGGGAAREEQTKEAPRISLKMFG